MFVSAIQSLRMNCFCRGTDFSDDRVEVVANIALRRREIAPAWKSESTVEPWRSRSSPPKQESADDRTGTYSAPAAGGSCRRTPLDNRFGGLTDAAATEQVAPLRDKLAGWRG